MRAGSTEKPQSGGHPDRGSGHPYVRHSLSRRGGDDRARGDVERLISHHADIDLRWGRARFAITTHDAGHKLTAADFDLARRIDAIARVHMAEPVDG